MKNTRVKILKIAIDFSEFMPKMITEYALKIMTHILVCPPKVKVSNFSFHGTPI
jgi:hypothetical protein